MEERIKQIMESQNLTQQNFAQILDLSPASLSSIFNRRTKPTMNHVEAIHKRFPNISMQWLLFGEGQMYGKNGDVQEGKSGSLFSSPTPQEEASEGSLFGQQNVSAPSPLNTQPSTVQSVKIVDKPQRKISEIRVFYDDQTWESFIVKK